MFSNIPGKYENVVFITRNPRKRNKCFYITGVYIIPFPPPPLGGERIQRSQKRGREGEGKEKGNSIEKVEKQLSELCEDIYSLHPWKTI